MAAIVGGSKVSSKITVLETLLDKCDTVVVGGGMVFTFLKAKGLSVGTSLVEDDFVETAKAVMAKAEKEGKRFILPSDVVVADALAPDAKTQIVPATAIPDGWMGLDNGPDATKEISEALSTCKTVIWNGPMGVFEFDAFAKGTFAIVDSGKADKMSHISTGGGASFELLEGKILPGVAALADAKVAA
ncbi:hypothetical protein TrCOL_g2122 [Triparma columacea]|uniref:Phosphoglycerate kinase n=1 Tax=Triparma columacea TaxID=722753 RepID=A0A9W7GCN7_9STRA|nr:hypothetical protein TrCOL_g2122 [Triparma columacea]